MHESDRAVNVGRGPACLRCGHTCHFSFVQIGTDRSRSGEKKGRGGRQLACLRHFEEVPEGRPRKSSQFRHFTGEFWFMT